MNLKRLKMSDLEKDKLILELQQRVNKLEGKDKYQYFISQNFDSTKIDDLIDIYKNLLFVKNEIIVKIEDEKNSKEIL